jgi:hypothetical protein
MVVKDRSGRTAIVLQAGRKWTQLVELVSGQLTIRKILNERMVDYRPLQYPLDQAVNKFLAHSGGVSDAARRELVSLLSHNEKEVA